MEFVIEKTIQYGMQTIERVLTPAMQAAMEEGNGVHESFSALRHANGPDEIYASSRRLLSELTTLIIA